MIAEKQLVIFSDGTLVGVNARPDGRLEIDINGIILGVLDTPGAMPQNDGAPVTYEPSVNVTPEPQEGPSTTIETDDNQESALNANSD